MGVLTLTLWTPRKWPPRDESRLSCPAVQGIAANRAKVTVGNHRTSFVHRAADMPTKKNEAREKLAPKVEEFQYRMALRI
mmetsp:Transcript_57316/g.100398  ORF Transcript_57316/g.100398 Transcript_57316/m.100398 type:complete len:80 (-) Transcript_57316:8-247(-)